MQLNTVGLIVTLALGMLVPPLAADAQPAGKIAWIGYLSARSSAAPGPQLIALRQGLHELGWIEGQNLLIEERWAEGRQERLPELAVHRTQILDLAAKSRLPTFFPGETVCGRWRPHVLWGEQF